MSDTLQQTGLIVDALQKVRDEALQHGRSLTDNGKGIDAHQVHSERLAYLATEVEAARSCLHYAQAAGENNADENGHTANMALGFAAEVGQRLVGQASTHIEDFGFDEAFLNDTLGQPQVKARHPGRSA